MAGGAAGAAEAAAAGVANQVSLFTSYRGPQLTVLPAIPLNPFEQSRHKMVVSRPHFSLGRVLHRIQGLNQEFTGEIRLHLAMSSMAPPKALPVQASMKRRSRFISHFVPTSSSRPKWFGEEGVLGRLEREPKPFIWTSTVEAIVEKLSRCRQTLDKIRPAVLDQKDEDQI